MHIWLKIQIKENLKKCLKLIFNIVIIIIRVEKKKEPPSGLEITRNQITYKVRILMQQQNIGKDVKIKI